MIKYGLISETDARTLEKTIDLICDEFKDESIEFTEVGVYSGLTGNSITKYFTSKQVASWWIGVDNLNDGQEFIYTPDRFIIGNSNEVYNQIENNSQHLIFIDADHSFLGVISDFYAYAPKVKVGGFIAFHDTGKHIKPFTDFQHGFRDNPDAYISCRKALNAIGLIEKARDPYYFATENFSKFSDKWQLIFDEADENDRAGGICVFKKLH